jgi:hypothetical protein
MFACPSQRLDWFVSWRFPHTMYPTHAVENLGSIPTILRKIIWAARLIVRVCDFALKWLPIFHQYRGRLINIIEWTMITLFTIGIWEGFYSWSNFLDRMVVGLKHWGGGDFGLSTPVTDIPLCFPRRKSSSHLVRIKTSQLFAMVQSSWKSSKPCGLYWYVTVFVIVRNLVSLISSYCVLCIAKYLMSTWLNGPACVTSCWVEWFLSMWRVYPWPICEQEWQNLKLRASWMDQLYWNNIWSSRMS